MIKCHFLPTPQLLVPVLLLKIASKLFFRLCKSCVGMKQIKAFDKLFHGAEGEHDNYQQRVFWGTLVTTELELGLLKSYRIIDLSDFCSWKKQKRCKVLFKEFIINFFKLETEASGWPPCDCKLDNENQLCRHKTQYLQENEQRENIEFDLSKVNRNE